MGTIAGPAAAIEIALTPINIAKSIDILTVNKASQTLLRSHREVCQYADFDKLKTQRLYVRNFIHGLKAELDGLVTDLNNDEIGSASTKRDIINTQINNSISNVVNGVETGFFPTTDKNIDDICQEPGCTPEDFQAMENRVPPDKAIKCRINYIDYLNYQARNKRANASILANNHDSVNSLKIELRDFDSVIYSEENIFGRTFGFGNVYVNGVKQNEYLKAINKPEGGIPKSFVPPIGSIAQYKRFFDASDFERTLNKNDAEIVILEYVLNKYVLKNQEKQIKLEIFTDRATCSSYTNIINNVIHSDKYISKTRNFNVELLKPDPIFLSKEDIPIKTNNFYLGLVN